jgi:hypothetical protein
VCRAANVIAQHARATALQHTHACCLQHPAATACPFLYCCERAGGDTLCHRPQRLLSYHAGGGDGDAGGGNSGSGGGGTGPTEDGSSSGYLLAEVREARIAVAALDRYLSHVTSFKDAGFELVEQAHLAMSRLEQVRQSQRAWFAGAAGATAAWRPVANAAFAHEALNVRVCACRLTKMGGDMHVEQAPGRRRLQPSMSYTRSCQQGHCNPRYAPPAR